MAGGGWEFFGDGASFLRAEGGLLARDPVAATVIATMARRTPAVQPEPGFTPWFAVYRDRSGDVVSAAMRTAPFAPHPLWLLPMPPDAAEELARELLARGEARVPFAVNGALPAVRHCAATLARHFEAVVRETMPTRLHRLDEVRWPRRPAGRLRLAGVDDLPLVREWLARFHHDADVQARRRPGVDETPSLEEVRHQLAGGKHWLFEADGVPVHLSGLNPPAYGVARIGPVFTPAAHRGRGYAAWTVATLSHRVLDAGAVPCLFTDLDNPISNELYERLGYRAVTDSANLLISGP